MLFNLFVLCAVATSTLGRPHAKRDGMLDQYTTSVTGYPTFDWHTYRPSGPPPQFSHPSFTWDWHTATHPTRGPGSYATNDWFSNLASEWATYHTHGRPTGYATGQPYGYRTGGGHHTTTETTSAPLKKRDGMLDPHTTPMTGLPTFDWYHPTGYPQFSTVEWDWETAHPSIPHITNDWVSNLVSDWVTYRHEHTYERSTAEPTTYEYTTAESTTPEPTTYESTTAESTTPEPTTYKPFFNPID